MATDKGPGKKKEPRIACNESVSRGLSVPFADRVILHIDNGKTDLYTGTQVRR